MWKISSLTLLATVLGSTLAALPAQAQATRTFVSGAGSDSNNCSVTAPCRTFQAAYTAVAAGGEIDVLTPAGYGTLTIGKALSIQAHGFGGITATGGATAITINAGTSDAVTLNGLLIDGAGTGLVGIEIIEAGSVQIVDCVVRHFSSLGIFYEPGNSPANLLVSDTIVSDNNGSGVYIQPSNGVTTTPVTLSGITANNNASYGVYVGNANVMIAHSVLSNNKDGLVGNGGATWLAKSVISGNSTDGVFVSGGPVNSYGDNDINGNTTDLSGTLTPASKQ
jgi:Right handed beta helix region